MTIIIIIIITIIIKAPCIYLYVTVLGCVFMQRLQQDLHPSFTRLVCAVLLQPGAEHSCPVRPAANISGYPGAAPLYMLTSGRYFRTKKKKDKVGKKASW